MDKLDELTRSVNRLAREASELRFELVRRTRLLWVALIALFIATVVVTGAAYAVTLDNAHAIERNNQKLCPMITILLPLPGDPPSTTDRGRLIIERAERVARDFHC